MISYLTKRITAIFKSTSANKSLNDCEISLDNKLVDIQSDLEKDVLIDDDGFD